MVNETSVFEQLKFYCINLFQIKSHLFYLFQVVLSFDRVFAAITFGGMHIGRTSSIAPDFTKAKLAAARLFAYMDTEPNIDVTKQEGKMLVRLHHFNGKLH